MNKDNGEGIVQGETIRSHVDTFGILLKYADKIKYATKFDIIRYYYSILYEKLV